jgi:hypothetical protein
MVILDLPSAKVGGFFCSTEFTLQGAKCCLAKTISGRQIPLGFTNIVWQNRRVLHLPNNIQIHVQGENSF